MGLFDSFRTGDPERDAAMSRGLLQAGLALMQAKGKLFPAIGQAGMVGVQAGDQYMQQARMEQMRKMQQEQLRLQTGQMQRQADIDSLGQQFFRRPEDFRGPMPEGETPQAGFDMKGYIEALRAKSPMQAIQLEAALQKQGPKLENVPEGAKVGYFDQATNKWVEVASNPKPEATSDDIREFNFAQARGDVKPGTTFTDWLRSNKAAGATRVNVPVNTERTYAGNVAEGLAKQDVEAIEVARSAPERIRAARRVKDIITKETPITGTGADFRLAVSRAFATAGLISEDSAAATEHLASTLASQTLSAIKSSGLGSGQGFTDKDRQFLELASSGRIEYTRGNLLRVAELNEKAAMRAIDRGNKVIQRMRGNKSLGSVGADLEPIEIPGETRMPTASEIEEEARRRGLR